MRAGLATLKKVEKIKAYEILEKKTEGFVKELNTRFRMSGLPMHVARFGSIFWIHGDAGGPIRRLEQIPKDHGANFKKVFHTCLENGVYLAPSGFEVGFLSIAHDDNLLERAIQVIEGSVKQHHGKK
jgi:glutamate-1-semialdehyde 2,1-aminomutase